MKTDFKVYYSSPSVPFRPLPHADDNDSSPIFLAQYTAKATFASAPMAPVCCRPWAIASPSLT